MSNSDIDTLIERCKALLREHREAEAADLLTQALESVADDRLHFYRGQAFELLAKPKHAIGDYTLAIELNPNCAEYYLGRGMVYAQDLLQHKEAIPDLLRAVDMDPLSVDAHVSLSLSLLQFVGQADRALHFAEIAADIAPDDPIARFCIGQAQLSLKQYDDAIRSFSRAVELDPVASQNWSGLASAYEHSTDPNGIELALQAYTSALGLDPDSPSYLTSLGSLQIRTGYTQEGVANLRRALSLSPTEAQRMVIQHNLAKAV